jgi:DNA gyrase/topoisomerase IV subunit A
MKIKKSRKEYMKEYLKRYYQKNKEKLLKEQKEYQQNHKEDRKEWRQLHKKELSEYQKQYCLEHREEIQHQSQEYKKEWYQKNRESILLERKEYQEINAEEIKDYQKTYRQEHKVELKEYIRNKMRTNINFRILHCLRKRVWEVLKGYNKSAHTMELVGCSIEQLKNHLEKQFSKGMSWDNYGKWHVDHVRPCASFDVSIPEQQKLCFNYTNLQPLWAVDNLIKSDKYKITTGENNG